MVWGTLKDETGPHNFFQFSTSADSQNGFEYGSRNQCPMTSEIRSLVASKRRLRWDWGSCAGDRFAAAIQNTSGKGMAAINGDRSYQQQGLTNPHPPGRLFVSQTAGPRFEPKLVTRRPFLGMHWWDGSRKKGTTKETYMSLCSWWLTFLPSREHLCHCQNMEHGLWLSHHH